MIIHSPIVSGSLTFADGSTFTLPDGGNFSGSFSGSVQISEVQSHLVPNANEVYDLGSSANRFRDLYLSNNTIDFPSGSFGFGNNGFGFSDPFGDPAPIVAAEVKVIDSADGSFAKLSVVGGELTTKAFDPFGVESAFDMKSQLSGSFTGSFLGEMLATNGVVSGSSQITLGSVTGFTAHSASVDGRILTEKGRVDAILASADADKDSFAEIVTLINSVDTTNDNTFASFYTASNDRFDNIEGFTSSIDTTIKTKMDADSVVSGSSQLVSLLPSGVVSSSAQVNADSITNFDSNVKSKLDVDGVISSSVQVDVLQTTNFNEFSASVATTFGGLSTDYNDLENIPSGIISSSEQLAADFLDTLGDNVVSGSSQIDLTQTTNYASGIKLKLDAENVFSSSAQVTIGDTTGFSEFSSSVSTTFDGLSSNYVDLVGIPSGIISSSDQLDSENLNLGIVTGSDIRSTGNVFAGGYIQSEDGLYVSIDGGASSFSVNEVGNTIIRGTLEIGSAVSGITDVSASIATNVASITSHTGRSDNPHSVTATQVGLGNVTNESKTTMFTSPTFTGTVSGVSKAHVGLGSVDNTSDAAKPVSTATQAALDLKANLASPTFTGTVSGVSKAMVGLGNVDNTSDADKPVSTAQQTALDLKATVSDLNTEKDRIDAILLSSDADKDSFAEIVTLINSVDTSNDSAFASHATNTSNPHSVTKAQVGLGSVDNTSDANKPISTATQTALNLKYDASNPAGYTTYTSNQATNTNSAVTFASVAGGTITGTSVSVTGDVVAYSSSDRRLKDNVKNIDFAIEKVTKLNGVTWDWNDNADELQKSLPNVGVIAQEVEEVLPQLVITRDTGYKGVDYAKLNGLLIEAIKDLHKQILDLESRIG